MNASAPTEDEGLRLIPEVSWSSTRAAESGSLSALLLPCHGVQCRHTRLDAAGFRTLDCAEWDALSVEASSENPFYSRQYVLAGLDTLDRAAGLQGVAIRTQEGRLVGLFPFRSSWTFALGAANLYQFGGAPLVDRGQAVAAVSSWLEGIRSGVLPAAWSLAHLRIDSELTRLIRQQADRAGLVTRVVNRYDRPRLTRASGDFEEHLKTVLAKNRRKDIERSIRRLRELGRLQYRRENRPDAVRELVSQFLLLEKEGWKGAAGTAFLSRPDHAAFARAAFGGAPGREGLASIDGLFLDDVPIALSINLSTGQTIFTPKCTYDERLRKLSPGIVLEYFVMERFFSDPSFSAMDASTTVDGHLVQGLWNEIMPMGNLVVGKKRAASLLAAALTGRERLKRWAKHVVRKANER